MQCENEELLPKGAIARIRIVHAEMTFTALGRVTYASQSVGLLGLAFTKVEPHQQSVLETWIAQSRG